MHVESEEQQRSFRGRGPMDKYLPYGLTPRMLRAAAVTALLLFVISNGADFRTREARNKAFIHGMG